MTDSTNAAVNGRHTPEVHVGKPSPSSGFQDDWFMTKVYFHEFEIMPQRTNEYAVSTFFCMGHEWRLTIYPRGLLDATEDAGEEVVSFRLCCYSKLAVKVKVGIAIENFASFYMEKEFKDEWRHGVNNLIEREKALSSLQHGALVVEVRMKPSEHISPFIPVNPFACKAIQDMYMDKESADVVFEVGKQHATTRANTKKLNAESTEFYAHRLVLTKAAPQLAELCLMSTESIIIPNVLPCIFKDMLSYIYGHPIQMLENDPTRLKNIIEVADIYGVTNLKLETEISYVSLIQKSFDVQNIMEHLLYADAMDLAYLKEAVMDFIVGNKVEIMKNKVLANAPRDVANEVLVAVARREERARANGKGGAAVNGRHTPEVHVGKPSPSSGFQDDWVTTKVYFHEFGILTANTECVKSSSFFCMGHEWRLTICPHGEIGREESNILSIFLQPLSSHAIKVTFGLAIENFASCTAEHEFKDREFGFVFHGREMALSSLQHGALVVEVRMKPSEHFPPFIPDNPFACKVIQDMYMDKESADVVFEVGKQHATTRTNAKKPKAEAASRFYAHRLVLTKAAPQLAELCLMSTESIIIPNVLPCIFKDMLLYIYGHPIQMLENDPTRLQNIIEAANKYGVTNLKLETEVSYVSLIQKSFDVQNIMEHLLYADAMDLAYLKEAVMDFIVGNKVDIVNNNVLANAPGDIANDVFAAVARREDRARIVGENDDVELGILGISDLRRRAHAIGLCVDGSRETLIAAIESMKVVVEKDD